MNVEDIFEQFGDIFGGVVLLIVFLEGSSRQRNKTNLRIKLKLTIQEIATGVKRRLKSKGLLLLQVI